MLLQLAVCDAADSELAQELAVPVAGLPPVALLAAAAAQLGLELELEPVPVPVPGLGLGPGPGLAPEPGLVRWRRQSTQNKRINVT